MRAIVQDSKTRLFYQGDGVWAEDFEAAHNFGSSLVAMDFCFENQLRNADVILCFSERQYDIRLSVFAGPLKHRPLKTIKRQRRGRLKGEG